MEVSGGGSLASTSSGPGVSSSDTCNLRTGSSSTGDPNLNPGAHSCRQSSRLKAKRSHVTVNSVETAESNGAADAPASGKGKKRGVVRSTEGEEKYNLRLSSLVKRVQVERKHATPREPKGKSKPPPLSKYRRRTANARERMRMRDINEGFERLKSCLPELEDHDHKGKKEKVTKFTILSLALSYIHGLREVLGYPPVPSPGSGGNATCVSDVASCSGSGHEGSDRTADSPASTQSIRCGSSSNSSNNSSNSISSSNNNSSITTYGSSDSARSTVSNNNSSASKDDNNNIINNSSSTINTVNIVNTGGTGVISPAASGSEDPDVGSDVAYTRALSASFSSSCSSASSDDLCSTPSPAPSLLELKEYYLPYTPMASDLGGGDVTLASALRLKNFVCSAPSVPAGMEVRGDVLCSPSPSLSSNSLSPPPPPLPLPEDCLVFGDPSLCLDLPMTLSTLQDCIDLGL